MKYIIEDNAGRYWTGDCWGVRHAAAEYISRDGLPVELPGDLVLDDDLHHYTDYETMEIAAGVVEVRDAGDPLPWENA